MKVLILGDGAREHALAWKFSVSRRTSGLSIGPGNAGTAELGTNLSDLDITDPDAVARRCREQHVDLVVVGGEEPLTAGVVDQLQHEGIAAIGPTQEAARLESSKVFSKELMQRHGIPTADARTFTDRGAFETYVRARTSPVVVKKSGLAGGKGVLESDDTEELLAFGGEILETDAVVVEERLTGYEVSIFALSDGRHYTLLPSAADYKKAGDGNTGPNTGGMGALAPVPWLPQEQLRRIETEVVSPTFAALREEELSYVGVLYFGLMITERGPFVLEYNVRFGDPEAQVILPLIRTDFGSLTSAMASGALADYPLHLSSASALGIVVASPGYPGRYKKNLPVASLPAGDGTARFLFHAATHAENGTVYTDGGRCFTGVALANELIEARNSAYELVEAVEFDGAWYRSDIGGQLFG